MLRRKKRRRIGKYAQNGKPVFRLNQSVFLTFPSVHVWTVKVTSHKRPLRAANYAGPFLVNQALRWSCCYGVNMVRIMSPRLKSPEGLNKRKKYKKIDHCHFRGISDLISLLL